MWLHDQVLRENTAQIVLHFAEMSSASCVIARP